MRTIERVLALVLGATSGATLHEFKVGKGHRLLWNRDILWEREGDAYLWPMQWLKDLLSEVKAMATPGTVISSGMWGADVVPLLPDGNIAGGGKVLHYRSVPTEFANQMMSHTGIPKHEWSRLMGHVHPEFYQSVFLTSYWRAYTGERRFLQVVPMADWITAQLSGQQGHDPVMLHNQGLGVPTSKLVNNWFDSDHLSRFAPVWKIFGPDEILSLGNVLSRDNGAFVVPCTHDSAIARLVLGLPWGLWTGSWYGIYRAIKDANEVAPGETTYKAGLVFEAMPGGVAAISNIGMDGPYWKALKNVKGTISYPEAARLALMKLGAIADKQLVFPRQMLQSEPENFAKSALAESHDDLSLALATMANTICLSSKSGLDAAALALGVQCPKKIAIVGGWAENAAILEGLTLYGIDAVTPLFASMATHAGLAARALCLSGMAKTIPEALEMFPDKALAE